MRSKSSFIFMSLICIALSGCKDDVNLPIVSSTTTVTNITDEAALSGGIVSENKGSTIIMRGICWSTKDNPTFNDSVTIDSLGKNQGIGQFSSKLRNLLPATLYYVRAYAFNSDGIGYGTTISFKTLKSLELADYTGTWYGREVGTVSVNTSGYGSTTEAVDNEINNVTVEKISDSQLLVNGDTATVSGKFLSFKTQKLYDASLNMNETVSKSGHLLYNKIEIYSTLTANYTLMGMTVSMYQKTTTSLER